MKHLYIRQWIDNLPPPFYKKEFTLALPAARKIPARKRRTAGREYLHLSTAKTPENRRKYKKLTRILTPALPYSPDPQSRAFFARGSGRIGQETIACSFFSKLV